MDKQTAMRIGAEVKAALEAVAAKHGMTVEFRGGTFDAGMYRPRVELHTADKARVEFQKYAGLFGLQPEDFGRTFTANGKPYTLVGVRLKGRAKPVIGADARGKLFIFDAALVKTSLGGQ